MEYKNSSPKNNFPLGKLLIIIIYGLISTPALALNLYWRPLQNPSNIPTLTDQNWATIANWSTTTPTYTAATAVPTIATSDVVYFDALDNTSCNMNYDYGVGAPLITSNTRGLNGIDMTGYAGTITQIAGNDFVIGKNNTNFATGVVIFSSGSFVGSTSSSDALWLICNAVATFSGGTFNAGNSDFRTLCMDVTISSGSFTSTTSTWRIFPTGNANGTFSFTGGSFTSPSGDVRVIPPGSGGTTYNLTFTGNPMTFNSLGFWTNAGANTVTINNTITVTGSSNGIGSQNGLPSFTLFGSGSLNYTNSAGTLSINTSTPTFINDLTVNIAGNLTIGNTATSGGGTGTINFNGTGAQTITGSATSGQGLLPNVSITKSSGTLTLSGSFVSLVGNWTDNNTGSGSWTTGTTTIAFYGTGIQTITKTGGGTETFYKITTNCTGPLTLEASTDIIVTNTLTMTAGNYNLNSRTFQLGNGSEGTLSRTSGTMYNGYFKRYINNTTAVISTSTPWDGLFPMGTSTFYRPIEINSTTNPTGAGYITASHSDAVLVSTVSYSDNLSNAIQARTDMKTTLLTSGGFGGGTYNLDVTLNDLNPTTTLSDLKMGIIAAPYGVGTAESATAGTIDAPVVKRTGVTPTEFNNDFVVTTINSASTPIRKFYYSRKTGNWDDVTPGNGTWSYTSGGAGASCDCVPISAGYVYISAGQTVSVNVPTTIQSVADIANGATLDGTAAFTVTQDITTSGTGKVAPTAGAWTISRNLILGTGTGNSTITSGSGIVGDITINAGATLTLLGTLALTGNLTVDGTLALGTNTFSHNGGVIKNITGTGTISGTGAGAINITTAKNISSSANLTITAPSVNITNTFTVTNYGTITLTGNLVGSFATSTLDNRGTINTTGTVLATGTLVTHNGVNTVNYNAVGAQTIKAPSVKYYNLSISGSGTKTFAVGGTISVINMVTVSGSAIMDESTNVLNGNGCGLTMTGTSELKLQRSTTATYPELSGTYSLTGGTVTLNQTANTATVRGATYWNLNFTGNTAANSLYDMSSVTSISGDFTIQNKSRMTSNGILTIAGTFFYTGTDVTATTLTNNITTGATSFTAASGGGIADGGKTIIVNGAGGWTRNTGFTFTPTGKVSFQGGTDQTVAGTAATESFYNLEILKTAGFTLSFGGSKTTLNVNNNFTQTTGNCNASTVATMNITGNATLSAGTFTGSPGIFLSGNWTNNGGTYTHSNGTITLQGGGTQNINGTSTSQTFYNITLSKGAGTLATAASLTSVTLQNITAGGGDFSGPATLNINGNFSLSAGTFTSGTDIFIKGNWTHNSLGTFSGGTGTVTFNNGGPQNLTGTAATKTFNHLAVDMGAGNTLTLVTTTTLNANNYTQTTGNFNSSAATTFNVTGTYTLSAGTFTAPPTLNLGGNVTMNGGTWTNGTNTNFNGSLSQVILGAGPFPDFSNMTFGNSAGITLNADVSLTGTCTLSGGVVSTGTNLLILKSTTAADLSGYSNTNFIYGNLRRYIANNTSTYTFPVGDGTATSNYKRVDLINANLTGGGFTYLDASVATNTKSGSNVDFNINTSIATQFGSALTTISGPTAGQAVEWTISPDFSPASGSYGVDLFVANTGLSGTEDDMFCVVKRPEGSSDYADWSSFEGSTTIPTGGSGGRIYNSGNGYARRTGFTSFSRFAIARAQAPLPIELIQFTAKLINQSAVILNWITATEINNDYFIIEKTKNGMDFSEVARLKGAGNSSKIMYYSAIDEKPFQGKSFYRLKQVNIDGTNSFSQMEEINLSGENETFYTVFPNPSKGENVKVSFGGYNSNEEVLVVLKDNLGRELFSTLVITDDSGKFITAIDFENRLPAGIYLIVGSSKNNIYSRKLVVR